MTEQVVQQPYSWRLFWTFFIAAILGAFAAAPMVFELLAPMLKEAEMPPVPFPVIVLVGMVQNLTLLALFVSLGLLLSGRLGLGPKLTRDWFSGSLTREKLTRAFKVGVVCGLGLGVILVPCIILLSTKVSGLPFVSAAKIAIWKRFLICFYGGIYEEIFARLFLLGLFAWLLNRNWKDNRRPLSNRVFWIANVIVAVLFGLGHLPSASFVMQITPLVVAVALALNGVASITFGWLYRKYDLETAIIAHFTADFALYVIGPMFLK